MPYIVPELREQLISGAIEPQSSGELNYMVTLLIVDYLEENGRSYQIFNDVIGALDGAKAEFYRRVVAPYEDRKRHVNGDVYPPNN